MTGRSKIQWTEQTWNPIVGCSIKSPGCSNCYAMPIAHRLGANPGTPHYAGTTRIAKGRAVWTGHVALAPDHVLTAPLGRRKPTVWFANSMGDLFHERVPDAWIDRVFAVMALASQHTFQVLTKRAARMVQYMRADPRERIGAIQRELDPRVTCYEDVDADAVWPLGNVWLGVSAERQTEADERIPDLYATPAAVRFVSAEPLIAPIDLGEYLGTGDKPPHHLVVKGLFRSDWRPPLHWVIVGGESGAGARPGALAWVRAIIAECRAAEVPCFIKQMGRRMIMNRMDAVQACAMGAGWSALEAGSPLGIVRFVHAKGGDPAEWPADLRVREYPQSRAQ